MFLKKNNNVVVKIFLLALLGGIIASIKTCKKTKVIMDTKIETSQSGLKYEILKKSSKDSISPQSGQAVHVHYTGWLEEEEKPGAKFDSSVDRGEPFTFIVGIGQVIKGWDEGVLKMKVGEKKRFFIPSHLAYGEYGIPSLIPGGATLIFDVELLEIS
ncbi:FKBP-type peptidyl-prolyl cis-trans isomerase [Candidatus Babeliales bacterium]|nr:FKBP-type peptidyl-prolyl cis-trans isomerase [Candidatus Babeliales bacterium]